VLRRVLVEYIRRARTERRRFFTCTEDHPPPKPTPHNSLGIFVFLHDTLEGLGLLDFPVLATWGCATDPMVLNQEQAVQWCDND